jgi:hypothetical protein
MKDVGESMSIWSILLPFRMYILWPFGKFFVSLVHFSRFGIFYQEYLATLYRWRLPRTKFPPFPTWQAGVTIAAASRCIFHPCVKTWRPLSTIFKSRPSLQPTITRSRGRSLSSKIAWRQRKYPFLYYVAKKVSIYLYCNKESIHLFIL